MPSYYIKITGSAWDVEAATPEEAIDLLRNCTHAYCSFTALEIGKDVDDKGWPIEKINPAGRAAFDRLS